MKKLKIFFILGEESGDILGEKLINSFLLLKNNIEFYGLAGPRMEKLGLKSIFPISDLSLMGFLEIIPHIPKLISRINFTVQKIKEINPDIVISIDSPDFSFRVIKKISNDQNLSKIKPLLRPISGFLFKLLSKFTRHKFISQQSKENKTLKKEFEKSYIKKIHLIAPSVWAYRENRAEKISKIYDLLLTILPFEPPYFEKYGLKTKFIGHPILENKKNDQFKGKFRKKYHILDKNKLICFTPGSRISEVKNILPEMIKTAVILRKKYDGNIKFAILITDKVKNYIETYIKNSNLEFLLIDQDNKYLLFQDADLAIAKSGTNNLEMSLMKLPLIVTYKVNLLTYFMLKIMIKIKFVNLINIISNKEIIPELLQFQCNPKNLSNKAIEFLENETMIKNQIENSQKALLSMGLEFKESPTMMAAKHILNIT